MLTIISLKHGIVKKPLFPSPKLILPPLRDPVVEMWTKSLSESNTKLRGDINCYMMHADPCIVIMKISVKIPLDLVRHL